MTIADPLAFWGNVIALGATALKTIYDLSINPSQFRREQDCYDLLIAVERKRSRADLSLAITFMILAFGNSLSVLALIKS